MAIELNKRITSHSIKIARLLEDAQSKDGCFESLVSNDKKFKNPTISRTTFFTSIILSSLNCMLSAYSAAGVILPEELLSIIERVRSKAAKFLAVQIRDDGSFNYYTKSKKGVLSEKVYPNDLDDTVLALDALYGYDQDFIDSEMFVRLVKLLTFQEVNVGGPYRTWIISPDHPTLGKEIDPIVNINIRTFLSRFGVELPAVEKFIEATHLNGQCSIYYFDNYSLFYFISRVPDRRASRVLAQKIRKLASGESLPFILALNASFHFRKSTPKIGQLIRMTNERFFNGNYPFGIEKIKNKEEYFSTTSAMLRALVLEACAHAVEANARKYASLRNNEITERLLKYATKKLPVGDRVFRGQQIKLLLNTLSKKMLAQILSLPTNTHKALLHPSKKIQDKIDDLSIANLYGWVGYTVADNILDGDASLALWSHSAALTRLSMKYYYRIVNDSVTKKLLDDIFLGMDEAIAWEQANCRDIFNPPNYGDYDILAKRSMGCAISPLIVLGESVAGIRRKRRALNNMYEYFRHYIIARQLNDDAHDWSEDLKNGAMNSVAAFLTRSIKHSKKLSIESLSAELNKIFFESGVTSLGNLIFTHLKKAEAALELLSRDMNIDFLTAEVQRLKSSVEVAIRENQEINKFIKQYK